MLDFLMEALERRLYRFITDNGAGGLSSSVGEMATNVGGCILHLDKAPLKYQGLKPWEILVSEAQERMSLAVPPDKMEALAELAKSREVEISDLGEFTREKQFIAYYEDNIICCLDMEFLHGGVPKMELKSVWKAPTIKEDNLLKKDLKTEILSLLSSPNIASKEYWVRQYDHEVQARSVLKPFTGIDENGPSDAAVLTPLLDSRRGLAVANGINPWYSDIDTYHMAKAVVDEAFRNLVAVGGDPDKVVGLDNFCWPDPVHSESCPDGEYKLAQLVRCNKGLRDICLQYNIPMISGKDSMKNDYGKGQKKISIPPTLLITAATTVPDIAQIISSDFKASGNKILLIGQTKNELGASEYFRQNHLTSRFIPTVNAEYNLNNYRSLHQAISENLVESCHDLSEGGLAIALIEMCIGGKKSSHIDLAAIDCKIKNNLSHNHFSNIRKEEKVKRILFSESQGRLLVEIHPKNLSSFLALFNDNNCQYRICLLGEVKAEEEIKIDFYSKRQVNLSLTEVTKAFSSLPQKMGMNP